MTVIAEKTFTIKYKLEVNGEPELDEALAMMHMRLIRFLPMHRVLNRFGIMRAKVLDRTITHD